MMQQVMFALLKNIKAPKCAALKKPLGEMNGLLHLSYVDLQKVWLTAGPESI